MRLNVCFNEMAPFGPFASFIKGCNTYDRDGKNGVSPQDDMAHPQGMKMLTAERHVLHEDFVYFRALCGVHNRCHSYLRRIGRLSGIRYNSGRHREIICASGLRSPELSTQVRQPNSYTSCKPAQMDAYITRTGRNGCVCVEDGRARWPRAFVVWM